MGSALTTTNPRLLQLRHDLWAQLGTPFKDQFKRQILNQFLRGLRVQHFGDLRMQLGEQLWKVKHGQNSTN